MNKRKRKSMAFKLDSKDPFLKNFKAYLESMFLGNRHRSNNGLDFSLTHSISYLNRISKKELNKLIKNQDYIGYMMMKIMENNNFIEMVKYGLKWHNDIFIKEIQSMLQERKEIVDIIRNQMEKSIYNMHLTAAKRLAKNANNYFSGKTYLYESYHFIENPYYDDYIKKEKIDLTWNDDKFRIEVKASYHDIFGILKAFETSEERRVGIEYKKIVMENKVKR